MKKTKTVKAGKRIVTEREQAEKAIASLQKYYQERICKAVIQLEALSRAAKKEKFDPMSFAAIGRQTEAYSTTMYKLDSILACVQRNLA